MAQRKTRPEAWWNKIPAEMREAVYDHGEAHSLEATLRWIEAEFGVATNRTSLSEWLELMRGEKSLQARFAERLERLQAASDRAEAVGEMVGKTCGLHEANVALLSQALLDAQLEGKGEEREALAIQLSGLIDSISKKERATAATETAALNRQKFQRDTCKLFLEWHESEEAKRIAAQPGTTQAQKIELLGQAMFGEDWGQ